MRVLAIAIALLCARPAASEACATAGPANARVAIADEEAVIAWDPVHHVEHFIRRAQFTSTARAFGFLVPTPTVPQLGEVDAEVFRILAQAIAPEIVDETSGFELGCVSSASKGEDAAARDKPVRVLSTSHVAGFEATTVEADDAKALATWLGAHGFASSPALESWLARYVADHWKITAFVVATDEPANNANYEVSTRAVRMTFATDRPFYPYREPANSSAGKRLLRVFFTSDQRYAATLGGAAAWIGLIKFAGPLAQPLPLAPFVPATPFTTVFEDGSSPRVGTDEVYFSPSTDQRILHPAPVVWNTPHMIPIDLIVVGLVLLSPVIGGIWIIVRRRRARA